MITNTTTKRPQPELLIDGCRGVHIPWHFAQYTSDYWQGINNEQLAVLACGPDNEEYWDVWDEVLVGAEHIDAQGNRWKLYQDGDLWAIPNGMVWDEDADWFVWPEDDDDEEESN